MELHRTGRLEEAASAYDDILAQDPEHHAALFAFSVLELGSGRLERAAELLERAIAAAPLNARYLVNLGEVKRRLGALDEAAAALSGALELEPNLSEAAFNLGLVHEGRSDPARAVAAFERAVRSRPESAPFRLGLLRALAGLAGKLTDHQKLVEAKAIGERALELDSDFAEAHYRLGNALFGLGEIGRAITHFRRAVELDPGQIVAHSNFVLALCYVPGTTARELSREARAWAVRHAESLAPREVRHPNVARPERRLRIGYVSPDFRRHPAAHFVLPILSHHDRKGFEVFCYSSLARPDSITDRVRATADVFHDVSGLDDAELAELVRKDEIDLLVDLSMHSGGHRLLAFARRPAPVQLTYLAYPGGTTGLSAIDYRITAAVLDPGDGEDEGCVEKALFLDETYWCFDPLEELLGAADGVSGPTPALAKGHLTFGSQNSFHKLTDQTLALWARVVAAHEGSRLVFHAPEMARARVLSRLTEAGVDPAVTLLPRCERADYLRAFAEMDLCFDSIPFNGATTTLDAFFAGVPTLTLAGALASGRAGQAICTTLGLPELVADSEHDFVLKALALTSDLSRLSELRATLRPRLLASPLMDAPRFVRGLEAAYCEAWRRWCNANA